MGFCSTFGLDGFNSLIISGVLFGNGCGILWFWVLIICGKLFRWGMVGN